MRLTIAAMGRLRAGPEASLIDDYSRRFDRTGRALSLGPLTLAEIDDRKGGGPAAEAALLLRALPEGARICALDERGTTMTSPHFADLLAGWRDEGVRDLGLLIGGAQGLDADLRARSDHLLSFGPMVWPHMLARVMLVEQLYRAASILAGAPYHRA